MTDGPQNRNEWDVFLDAVSAMPENTSDDQLRRAGLTALKNYRQRKRNDG